MREEQLRELIATRVRNPQAIAEAAAHRTRPASLLAEHGRLMMIAADHPARGALRAGERALAMADRADLIDRLVLALSRPGVNGVLGTPDILEDLLLLGALEDKVVVGSMNRGGLAGTTFELDDRFTAYDAAAIVGSGFEGGKMLTRIDPDDPATVVTLEACARAVSDLADHGLMAAMAATTLPALILGGEVGQDQDVTFASWAKALALPTVQGLVIGRSLLYPPGDDVAAAVDAAVGLL